MHTSIASLERTSEQLAAAGPPAFSAFHGHMHLLPKPLGYPSMCLGVLQCVHASSGWAPPPRRPRMTSVGRVIQQMHYISQSGLRQYEDSDGSEEWEEVEAEVPPGSGSLHEGEGSTCDGDMVPGTPQTTQVSSTA
jgi:hypothetical protein